MTTHYLMGRVNNAFEMISPEVSVRLNQLLIGLPSLFILNFNEIIPQMLWRARYLKPFHKDHPIPLAVE
jgi:hypothetical protein